MEFLIMIATSIGVGAFAQKSKGRTGAAWGFLTFIILVLVLALTLSSQHQQVNPIVAGITASLVGGAIMMGIVATLPRPRA